MIPTGTGIWLETALLTLEDRSQNFDNADQLNDGAPRDNFAGWDAATVRSPVPKAVLLRRRWLEQVENGPDRNGLGLRDFRENSMERANLERVVIGNGNRMRGRRFVEKPYMASLLANHGVAEAPQSANQPAGRYGARQFHAASTGISSSFTKCS